MTIRLVNALVAVTATVAQLSACAGATTRLPQLSPGAIEAEQEKQRELSIQDNERQQARLDSITYPLLAQSTSLCPSDRGPLPGLRLATVHTYEKEWQAAAASVLGLGDTLTVTGVVPGAPAARAGLRPGDRILSLGEISIPPGPKATTTFSEAFAALGRRDAPSQVDVLYSRAGAQRRATVTLAPVCAYGTVLVNTGELNAFADGERIYVTSTMMRFASDEELRVVVAHELAHNAMEHIEARKKNALFGGLLGAVADVFMATQGVNTGGYYSSRYAKLGSESFSQDFEREADYVGLYAMALAGAPLHAAPRFWRHMAQEDPESIQLAYTHPTTAERFVRMEHSIKEIERKRAGQLALLPERRARAERNDPNEANGPVLASKAPVQGYAPDGPGEPPADGSFEISRTNAELARDVALRRAMEDVQRLGIADSIREVRPGLLSVLVGPGYGMSSTDYNLSRLLAAYRGTVEWDHSAVLELRRDHQKLGQFTGSGFRPTPGVASP